MHRKTCMYMSTQNILSDMQNRVICMPYMIGIALCDKNEYELLT